MSAKGVVQSLEDSELIRLFLDFIATHRLHYQKTRKEISYKCFEATWLLPIAKATGYGRTETEAYKNALKNLLQLLMEDSSYTEYFSNILPKHPRSQKDTSPPPKMQLKTEGQEPDAHRLKVQYDSCSRMPIPKSRQEVPFNNRQDNHQETNSNSRQEVQHSKINLNRSMSHKADPEMEEARSRLKALENKVSSVLEENKALREQVLNSQQKPRQSIEVKKVAEGERLLKKTSQCKPSQKTLNVESGGGRKVGIPRLKLEVLPNYHKKSQKCLNEVLLASYQEKHGMEKGY